MRQNRRSFLGLLAAAPLLAPALANEMVAPQFASGELIEGLEFKFYPGTEHVSGFDIITNAKPGLYRLARPTRFDMEDGSQIFGIGEVRIGCTLTEIKPAAPNRLCGAYLNADGDAV